MSTLIKTPNYKYVILVFNDTSRIDIHQ
jgi:hypothetical protein